MSVNDTSQCEGWRRQPGTQPVRCTALATRKITIVPASSSDLPDYLKDHAPISLFLCGVCASEYHEHNAHRILSDEPLDAEAGAVVEAVA